MSRFVLVSPLVRSNALDAVRTAPDGYVVEIKQAKRSLAQNAFLWQCLTDVADQVDWYGQRLSKEDWKDMFTASLRKARVVPGLDPGSFVVMGLHTSTMSKAELGDLLTLIHAFGAEKGVVFTDMRGLE